MRRVLIFLTSSYPFGSGEPFIANEIAYLEAAFDELIIVSNDTDDVPQYPVPAGATLLRVPYSLPPWKKPSSVFSIFCPEPRDELRWASRSGDRITRRLIATVLVSWGKAKRLSHTIWRLAKERPGSLVYAYSYWANDMAVAAAMARRKGWVHRAVCRAHRWDVYSEADKEGFLPFRRFLASSLDRYLFISEDGLKHFKQRVGDSFGSIGCSRLGTPIMTSAPLARQDPFVVISCSNLIPRKRVERIPEALRNLKRDVTWIHVGAGPSLNAVESACAHLPPNIHVELLGQRSNTEVPQIFRLRRPSVFINLSESEGVPVSIMEAMSAGVPVIATEVGGVAEIVKTGCNGRLLSPNPEIPEVTAALETFATLPEGSYRAYAEGAWSTWDREFNADRNYRDFVNLLVR